MNRDALRDIVRFLAEVWTGSGRGSLQAVLLVAAAAAIEAAALLMLTPVLQLALDDGAADWRRPIEAVLGPGAAPVALLILLAFAMSVRSLALWRRDVVLAERQTHFLEQRRLAIATGLSRACWATIARLGHGRVAHIMGGDMTRVTAGVHFALQGLVALLTLAALVAAVLTLAPAPAIAAVGLMALAAWSMSRLTRRASEAGDRIASANRSLTIGVGAFLRGIKAAKSQGLQQPFLDGFARDLGEASRAQVSFQGQQAVVRAIWPLVAVGAVGGIVVAARMSGLQGGPTLIVLLVMLWRMVGPAAQLQNGFQQVVFALPAWRAMRELDEELQAGAEPGVAVRVAPPEGPVQLRAVTARHEDGGGVVGVSLDLSPGEWLGLAGPAGAGKTTLADVIAGLRPPDSGEIFIGGRPMDSEIAEAWRGSLSYIPQDAFLMDDSVRANLAWSRPGVDEADMMRALDIVGATERVARLRGGLDARVGENGALISGGERQRLALARALLRTPRLMILDEATNAIDLDGEAELLTALRASAPDMSVILIAHRRETLAACDRVLSLDRGTVVATQGLGA